ncbi:MAG: ferrous iron transporter B [Myxococcales bacterium]|nr:ferrous iron transporter B [Polyangiaceae bacterium]MDW8247944.1 ferrous iron transporter B [Myxococcales bacterium]
MNSPLQVALLGRPNTGKSSLFNRLTNTHAHIGNFPGVTVDVLTGEARLPSGECCQIHDLPGIYRLDPGPGGSADERVTIDFLRERVATGAPLVLVHVLDATQLVLHLRLTREILDQLPGQRLLLVVTQRDALERAGGFLDGEALAAAVRLPVRVVSHQDPDLISVVLEAIPKTPPTKPTPWTPEDAARAALRPPEHAASPQERSERIDRVLLHPILGPLLFVLILGATFAAVFLIADPASSFFNVLLGRLVSILRPRLGEGLLAALLLEGVLGGVGTVLAFVPQIVVLMGLLEVLEASGYLARAAFLIDRFFRVVGLSGKAFVPLLTAHACAVPAISATRVLRDPKERLATILVLPLMSCSARLPTYTLLVSAFFGGTTVHKAAVSTGLYLVGILGGLVAASVMRRTMARGKGLPLLLEMPTYKAPSWRQIQVRCGREARDFTRRAGTVILAASVLLWVLLKLPVSDDPSGQTPVIERSAAAMVGKALEPISKPIGFDWRINVGLIGAFGARELMVSTLGVIFGVENAEEEPAPLADKLREAKTSQGTPAYSTATAAALLAFFVFACQCISTLSTVYRETRSWPLTGFVFLYTYALAYLAAFLAYHGVRLFTA